MKFCGWIDLIRGGSAVHMNCNSCLLNFLFIALCLFSYLNFVGAYLQGYTSYGNEISWMVTTWDKMAIFCDNLPLLFHNVFLKLFSSMFKNEYIEERINYKKFISQCRKITDNSMIRIHCLVSCIWNRQQSICYELLHKFEFVLINCMAFNVVFNSISVILWQPVQLSMLSWSSFNQYSAQYSFQVTRCFPT